MWRCDHCGGTDIIRRVSGIFDGEETSLDRTGHSKNGIDPYDLLIESSEYYCNDCGNSDDNLQDMASWVEEE